MTVVHISGASTKYLLVVPPSDVNWLPHFFCFVGILGFRKCESVSWIVRTPCARRPSLSRLSPLEICRKHMSSGQITKTGNRLSIWPAIFQWNVRVHSVSHMVMHTYVAPATIAEDQEIRGA